MSTGTSRPRPTPAPRPLRARAVPLHTGTRRPDHPLPWEELRARFGAVAPVEITPGVPGWLLLGYHENLDALRDFDRFAATPDRWTTAPQQPREEENGSAPAAEGERHHRMRAPVVEGLRAVGGRRLTETARTLATSLVDRFAPRGRADLVADYAVPLPAMVLNSLFGLDERYGDLLARLCAARDGEDPATAARATADLHRYTTALVARRRADPGDDLVSQLLRHPVGLTDAEAAAALDTLVRTGVAPTAHLVGNALRLLLTRPEIAAAHRCGALPCTDFLDYVMWVDPPLQTLQARCPTRDVRIGGVDIRKGEPLVLGFAPAHADPTVRRGRTLDDLAGNRAHLMWGAGPHRCPAQELASGIAVTAVDTVVDRLGPVLDDPPHSLRRHAPPAVHAPAALPVRFSAEPAPSAPEPPPSRAGRRPPPVRTGRPRARGARYGAPEAADEAPAPTAAVRRARVGAPAPRTAGVRYHVPARQERRPDPLEGLLARWT
ncbi:cytochrome P450 [Thermobifida alba]|uniref:Cytochrome P450 n=1 Tax=Thermobifida alba TaxID=53522 RepID=A0ABY4KZV8_THEAE|nr:cytochrome P450 [Thermobifida alba]UPT20968.1 cytochrome P450 [Thermobifida alba]